MRTLPGLQQGVAQRFGGGRRHAECRREQPRLVFAFGMQWVHAVVAQLANIDRRVFRMGIRIRTLQIQK